MTAQEFCYWLKGYLELSEVDLNKVSFATTLSVQQVKCINEHLGYVFAPKVTVSPQPITQTGASSLIEKALGGGFVVC